MSVTVTELAKLVGGAVEGDGALAICGICGLDAGRADQVSFLANPKYASLMATTKAGAVVVGNRFRGRAAGALIRCVNPDAAFARIALIFAPPAVRDPRGVHASAVVSPRATIAADASIGALVFVDEEAEVGAGTVIRPGSYIGRGVKIGRDCLIYPNVTIREGSIIGDRVIIHAGAVVGADGFGYTMSEGQLLKIPQIGRVVIEDDVEIGANVTIDRARIDQTVIERGVKIDNLVQIAHNVRVGAGSVIVSQCAIAGSTTLGRNCQLGGQVAIDGHLVIGDNVRIAAKSGVTKDIPAGRAVGGFPAQDHRAELRLVAELRKLAGAAKRIEQLEQQLAALQQRHGG